MSISIFLRRLGLAAALLASGAHAFGIEVPGANGADGDFAPTKDITIDLEGAPAKAWNQNPETPGTGVYDADKWAVVFKYKSVSIPAGVTVTFQNNHSRAPVVWLVEGDVVINGALRLDGDHASWHASSRYKAEVPVPGPGGFRGGSGYRRVMDADATPGFGPGGGASSPWQSYAGSAGHSSVGRGEGRGRAYSSSLLRPLLGGSGGGGVTSPTSGAASAGGAGGGAILIAASGTIVVNGLLSAQGGSGGRSGDQNQGWGGGGSGGGIRLISDRVAGSGRITVLGGSTRDSAGYEGAPGRIRIEAREISGLDLVPATQPEEPGAVAKLWPEAETPVIRIVSIAGTTPGPDPSASIGPEPADVTLRGAGSGEIVLESLNLPPNAEVKVRWVNKSGGGGEVAAELIPATNPLRWRAPINLAGGFHVLQARAVAP